jgi:hypothetical protein
LEKGVEGEIASFENKCSIDIDWASTEDILRPAHYVEPVGLAAAVKATG